MRQQPSAPARAVRRRPLAIALPAVAACVLATLALVVPPAQAQTAGDVDPAPAPVASLAPLFEPVGSLAGSGVDLVAAATTHMITAATPPPPPTHVCPAPGSKFIDSWGFARSGGRRHEGVDMMAPHGTPVYAPAAGTIRASSSALGGLGFWLESPDGNTYFGSHLQTLTVREGWVEPGTPIGTVGATGNAGGTPHLHFEVMTAAAGSVNPYPFVLDWCGSEAPPLTR